MKALCWYGTHDVRVETVPDPTILNPTDAIIDTSLTAICGSDLHLYDGYIPTMEEGDILGHEFMGVVDKLNLGAAFGKGLTMKMGQTHVQKYLPKLLGHIEAGEIDPASIITHSVPLDRAPEMYETFKNKRDGCVKVVLTHRGFSFSQPLNSRPMPYDTLDERPDSVKSSLPKHGQEIYQSAYNNAWDECADPGDRRERADSREETAHEVAWGAVKTQYEKQGDRWTRKSE